MVMMIFIFIFGDDGSDHMVMEMMRVSRRMTKV